MCFKQFQFWTTGVLQLIFTAATYSYCVNVRGPSNVKRCGASEIDSSDNDIIAIWGTNAALLLLFASCAY